MSLHILINNILHSDLLDSMGEFKTFLFHYHHDESEWSIEIQAESLEDARARLAKLPYAKYDGELAAEFPVEFGFFAKCYTAARNFLSV